MSVDGSFIQKVMGKQGVEIGYKGKGNLLHLMVDNQGIPMLMEMSPANGDERVFARKMVKECVKKHNIKFGILQADKGYDDQKIRGLVQNILGADSDIPRRKNSRAKSTVGELIENNKLLDETYKDNNRYVVERTFGILKRRWRRFNGRYELKLVNFVGIIRLGIIMMLIDLFL